ncbi:bifunctional tetrahydrofolate synthase/dihydrofolate synthase [Halomonas urmiana]|uniref:Dihydrofolate synthase/folylpolyglutamate synthase n=1 Tax=Halomonas urmiana TaxID=490901 RepID=A0A5R8MES4_9GAMM|nr:bifunctional tetrahydrofolate synthase/dihydrofolate synthase [Halomonas urmiana]TLF48615.1 bifunctional tetrahydrofolate synthase/dihydrofolate synthase [Halomonas urmiana]
MSECALPTTLPAWLTRLEAAHPVGIDLGLDRVAEVARRMGLCEAPPAARVITVAGTNGKGSTVAMLEALAQAHGLTTATYTSPHLLRYNERLRLDGRQADDATLIAGFEAVETARLKGEPISLSYFEMGTLGALWAIARQPPALAILEVGLGGRLDAVNIIDPDVAVITTVAQDHAAFLGNDIEGIGREKAGILRPGRPAVLGSTTLPASVADVATTLGAPVYALGEAFRREGDGEGWRFWGQTPAESKSLVDLPDPELPLDNAATALQALALAGVSLEAAACRRALASVRLPGRMQWLGPWCLDVGHNPHAAAYVAQRLAARPCAGRTVALIGMLADKDADGVIAALAPAVDAWVLASLEGERARSADDLAEHLARQGATLWHRGDSPAEAADWLSARLAPEDRVLVCGSFFTVAAVLAWHQAAAPSAGPTAGHATRSEEAR